MPNGRTLFLAAVYQIPGKFSHLPRFVDTFSDDLHNLPFSSGEVLLKIQELKKRLNSKWQGKKIDKNNALSLLLFEEVQKIETVLLDESFVKKIESEENIEEILNEVCRKAILILNEIGVPSTTPSLFFVKDLPAPYNNAGFFALTTDEGDRAQHGIEPGVYFLKDKLRPFYSEFLLLHELIHAVVGTKSPLLLGRGLEEGLAEVVGSIYLSNRILGKELTTRLFIYNRLSFGFNQFWEVYLDYTRQATYILNNYGVAGLVDLLNGGREKIKNVEQKCLKGQFEKITLSKGNFDLGTIEIANYISLNFGRNLVLSPLAYFVNRYIVQGKTRHEILTEANVDLTDGFGALKEIEERLYLAHFREDNSVCTFSDSQLLKEIIRFEV